MSEVIYSIEVEQDDTPVRGNAMASGPATSHPCRFPKRHTLAVTVLEVQKRK